MKLFKLPINKCREKTCASKVEQDGWCRNHWDFFLKGMSNRERMAEKKNLREMRRAQEREMQGVSR